METKPEGPDPQRSRVMSRIRGSNTKPEILIRKMLHARGFRFRLHRKDLPGRPDIVLPRYNAVIFVNGCFWHGHNCHLFRSPKTREDFWHEKLNTNIERDRRNIALLRQSGWRVYIVWECAVRNSTQKDIQSLSDDIKEWLLSESTAGESHGKD